VHFLLQNLAADLLAEYFLLLLQVYEIHLHLLNLLKKYYHLLLQK
jgi:hypothetical protein